MKVILTFISIVFGENIAVSHHDISATVQMVGGFIACSVSSFPFAKNIDCTGPLKPGAHCDHQCGDVDVRSPSIKFLLMHSDSGFIPVK